MWCERACLVRHIWALRPFRCLAMSAQWLPWLSCSARSFASSAFVQGTRSARLGSSFLWEPHNC